MLRTCNKCGETKEIIRFVRQTGKYRSDPYRKDCKDCKNAKRRTGKPNLGRFVKGQVTWNKGISLTEEVKRKLSISKKGQLAWNLGLRNSEKRFSRKYKEWRDKVKERDNFKCQSCLTEQDLHVHHIKPWKYYPKLRYDLENGQTLCRSCHSNIEGYQKGHMQSEESRKKMSLAKKGKAPWNKGIKHGSKCQCN